MILTSDRDAARTLLEGATKFFVREVQLVAPMIFMTEAAVHGPVRVVASLVQRAAISTMSRS